MHHRGARPAAAFGAAALLVSALACCGQSTSVEDDPTDLSIVAQLAIDETGAEVQQPQRAADPDPAGDGTATCPPLSIAVAGERGTHFGNGVQLAVDKHNAANPACQVRLVPSDTDPGQVVFELMGPSFPAAADAPFDFHGRALANYLRDTLSHRKVCVVDDSTDDGAGLAQVVRETLGPVADLVCHISVRKDHTDFFAAITQIRSVAPDSVFFSGSYPQTGPFVRQLRDAGVDALFVSADGSMDPAFVTDAGAAAAGTVLSCPCRPTPPAFAEQYRQRFGQQPGAYGIEGYDLATLVLQGIDSGAHTRPALAEYLPDNREAVWIYRVQ